MEKKESRRKPKLNLFYNLLLTHIYLKGLLFSCACNIQAFFILYTNAFSPNSDWWGILIYILAVLTSIVIFLILSWSMSSILRNLQHYYRPPLRIKVCEAMIISGIFIYAIASIVYCAYEVHVHNRIIDVIMMSIHGGILLCDSIYKVIS